MKTKLLNSFILFLSLFFINGLTAQIFSVNNINYQVTSSIAPLKVKVINSIGSPNYGGYTGDISIPSTVSNGSNTYNVTEIGNYAFKNCTGLTSVTIPDSVTVIGAYVFESSGLTSISIPNFVTSIGNGAFKNCIGLTSISIPNSVTTIGSGTFYGCTGLTSVTIGSSVTSINDFAFYKCTGLTSVSIPDSVTFIGVNAFDSSGLTSISIPNFVTSIANSAFSNCIGLTSVTIPNSVTSIGVQAFYGCTGLTSVTIPDSVTSIGNQAFYNCSALTSLAISNSVTSIGMEAFRGCAGLTSVTIPASVTSIGDKAFNICNKLTSFTSLATTPPTLGGISVFMGTWQKNCDLFVPENSKTAYAAAAQWNGFRSVDTSYLSTTETKINLLKVYPNPAKDYVVISNSSKGDNVSVYDLSGKILFQTKSSGNYITINTSSYKNGVYLVKVDENITKIMVSK